MRRTSARRCARHGGLRRRADEIEPPSPRSNRRCASIAPLQFDDGFRERARSRLAGGARHRRSAASAARDAGPRRSTCARSTRTACWRRSAAWSSARSIATSRACSDGESAEALIRRWGFHAIDITPCADGRLSGVVDYILRVPPAVVASRKSYAGAMFDVEEALRTLGEPSSCAAGAKGGRTPPTEPTRYLKIGVYHFSSVDPAHEGCAAHGSDAARAAAALLERLEQFAQAVETDALLRRGRRDAAGRRRHRYRCDPRARPRCARARIGSTATSTTARSTTRTAALSREAAKDAIREAVAALRRRRAGRRRDRRHALVLRLPAEEQHRPDRCRARAATAGRMPIAATPSA